MKELNMENKKDTQNREKQEHVQRMVIWLPPDIIPRMDGWVKADNCKNRSEFITRAVRFYMGYLATEDITEFLSRSLVTTLRGIIEENTNRVCCLLFKLCVELT